MDQFAEPKDPDGDVKKICQYWESHTRTRKTFY